MINYSPKDKQKALDLANKLEFSDINITDNHSETSLVLFMDDNNGTWTIDGTYHGKYKLSYEGKKITCIEKYLEDEIDVFIEEYKNEDERIKHDEEVFREMDDERWRNTNRNHF